MLRLKDRNRQIPGGMSFYLPEVKWKAPGNFPSFDTIANALLRVIQANPALAKKHGWPTHIAAVENWVDLYNATVCAHMGWTDYIFTEGAEAVSIPKSSPPHQTLSLSGLAAAGAKAMELVRGAKTLSEWVESNEAPVTSDLSTHRAIICSQCPKNAKGDWTQWFASPAAELIKRLVEKAQSRKLTTPRDDQLQCCTICYCPLTLKVHVGIEWIKKRMKPDEAAKLKAVPNCWIASEGNL